ncbi:MAG: hypothetical protein K2G30_11435, partial [Muribaculaceae bacterium]|nr:hypothetical protein [Muribaculaceae bacterium]
GRNASGNAHSAIFVPQVLGKARPLSEWRNAGIVKAHDGIAGCMFQSKPTLSFTVELLENPDVEGVYLLPDYYQKAFKSSGFGGPFDSAVSDPFVLDLRGEYPLLTNSLSGVRCTGEMMTGISYPYDDETVYQLRVMNACDFYNEYNNEYYYGAITRGADGSIQKVDFPDSGLIVVVYNSLSGEYLGTSRIAPTWIDFSYADYVRPENWQHAGIATVTENIVGQLFGAGENTAECEVYTCLFEEGLYRLDAPLAGMPFAAYGGEYIQDMSHTLYIHAADPGKVYLTISPEETLSTANWQWRTGWTDANWPKYLCMVANALATGALNDGLNLEDYLGTFDREKGEFVLDNCFFQHYSQTSTIMKPENPRFRVVLGELSGVDESVTAGVVSVEYYSVDGRRLAAPADGLSIRLTRYTDGRIVTDKVVF